MGKKIIEVFQAKLYMCNTDVVQQCLSSHSIPDEDYFEAKKMSFIEDFDNNTKYVTGDFDGDDEYHGFTLKIFIYKDGKALGHCKYLAEAEMPSETIDSKYIQGDEDFIIYGFFLIPKKEGKESFILFINKPDIKQQTVKHPHAVKKDIVQSIKITKKITTNKVTIEPLKKLVKANTDEISIKNNFIKLTPDAEKLSCLYFLSYILSKLGYSVQMTYNSNNFPELIILKREKHLYIHVYISARHIGAWDIQIKEKKENHFFVFCHVLSKEFFPDVYILPSRLIKNGRISIEDRRMLKIKNSWEHLID